MERQVYRDRRIGQAQFCPDPRAAGCAREQRRIVPLIAPGKSRMSQGRTERNCHGAADFQTGAAVPAVLLPPCGRPCGGRDAAATVRRESRGGPGMLARLAVERAGT
ncbi:MAG: hypothetical protein ACOC46_01495, partial [Pirellulales bacterium]